MVSTILTSVAQSSLYCLSDSSTPISFRSICCFNRPKFSSNFTTSSSIPIPQPVLSSVCFFNGNFDSKERGLNSSINKRWHWHVPWQWQPASFTSLACELSSVLTGLAETTPIPFTRIENNELRMDQEAELLFLDQCITTAVVLGVIYSFTNVLQLLLQHIFGYDLRGPFDIHKGWISWEVTYLMGARLVASTRFSMSTFRARREMSSNCSSFGPLVAQWRHCNTRFLIFFHTKRKISLSSLIYCSNYESISRQSQLNYDPAEELLGIEADPNPRNVNSSESKPKSWFGPNGQYIRELPCPSCRGRGYTPCTECGIERSRLDCSQCSGKGIITCHQCSGDCVIWEESIDEQPWEKARSISPLIVKEDDEVDNLEIKLDKKKSKRVYQSPRPEVGQKISRSLKSLNAKTGLFSKRMKLIHRDPVLRAQRVAAIKKAKGTAAARKHTSETLKAFFSDPENRHRRSLAMKGVKFFCKNCGREGHRKHYCPELKEDSLDRQFRCRSCGEKGHNRRTCPKSEINSHQNAGKRHYHCKICHGRGHNCRTCPKLTDSKSGGGNKKKSLLLSNRRIYNCRLCGEKGHNVRTCANRNADPATVKSSL